MKKQLQSLCRWLLVFVPTAAVAGSGWLLDKKVDPLTDQNVVTALSSYSVGITKRTAIVRCTGAKLEVYFDFGEFLNNDLVPIRYRVDKASLVDEEWFPSADGTAVFAKEGAELARLLMGGSMLIIEAQDFRGQPHRASFDLTGANTALKPVLEQCGVSQVGMDQQIEGLRREVALELERWGPKTISMNKRILASLGAYNGAQDTSIGPDFALAVQSFYDAYISKCRDGQLRGVKNNYCYSLRVFWKAGMRPVMRAISAVIYEQSPSELKQEAGKLGMGE